MTEQDFIAVIPARYASSRFPGKPLAKIGDMTMIERVYRQVKKAVENVYVATDDERIANTVKEFGGNVVMTGTHHKSGTDRCYEAYLNIGSNAKVIINVQGDEPFVDPSQIRTIKECFADNATQIATLIRPFDPSRGFEALFDKNTPKVVIDNDMYALYFSRSIIPYVRNYEWNEWVDKTQYYTHIGMYAYRADILKEITALPQSSLEIAESLEQLRWLQNGYKIKTGMSKCPTIGIDTPDDLERARKYVTEHHD
ncbi:MAG: 3-deoxy-manno-octulosonate cytidylyltransferase [Muribaculaceae bacterium]|nr:3-deoxy-manno-octulosonate cytidylyltransferase [Muribaculaceae bacterium]